MNNSYDEDDEELKIVIKNKKRNKCICCYYCTCEFIIKMIACILLFIIFELLIYHIVKEYKEYNSDEGFKYLEKNNSLDSNRRRLGPIFKHHPCKNYKYGCCSLYTGDYINGSSYNIKEYTFKGNYNKIRKEDEFGSNCPNLISVISKHNEKHGSKNSCLNDPNKNKCCKFDIMTDQIEYHNRSFKHNKNYINHYLNIRYKYLIDYDNGNCPSVLEMMNEYRNPQYCNERYEDCHMYDMKLMTILFIVILIILFICYIKLQCNLNYENIILCFKQKYSSVDSEINTIKNRGEV